MLKNCIHCLTLTHIRLLRTLQFYPVIISAEKKSLIYLFTAGILFRLHYNVKPHNNKKYSFYFSQFLESVSKPFEHKHATDLLDCFAGSAAQIFAIPHCKSAGILKGILNISLQKKHIVNPLP